MGKNSAIAWTDHTFNPWWGCTKISKGCAKCYAETWAKRTGQNVWGPDAPRRFFGDKHWREPLTWNGLAEREHRRALVFCASMGDVFERHPDQEINRQLNNARSRLFLETIPATPWLNWMLLTKRVENIFSLGTDAAGKIFDLYLADYPNVWIGATVESKESLHRLNVLDTIGTSVAWLSLEPMLEPICLNLKAQYVKWVIVGGESGPGCRKFEWEWARDIRDQCRDAGVAFFMKQGGGHPNKRDQLEDMPEDLRIRERP